MDDRRLLRVDLPLSDAWVTPVNCQDFYEWVAKAVGLNGKTIVLAHNLHSLYVWETDPEFRNLYSKADVVLMDGFPVLKLAKWVSGLQLTSEYRVGTLDWLPELFRRTPVRRLALVGATPEGNAKSVSLLRSHNPNVAVRGWPGEGWTDSMATNAVSDLKLFRPDMVLIGLGMPLQEKFLSQYLDQLPDAIYATVGGGIDEFSGVQKPPPRWLGKFGLEWLFRVITQPRRLSERYLIEPWKLIFHLGHRLVMEKWARGRMHK